jgi:hypothetical protein
MRSKACFAVVGSVVVVAVSCSSSDDNTAANGSQNPFEAGTDGTGPQDSGGSGGDSSLMFDTGESGAACTDDTACDGGVCVQGACCPSAARACGDRCCAEAETCFAAACVTPGKTCHATADCDPGQYCELGLGEQAPGSDGGATDATPGGDGSTDAPASDSGGTDGGTQVCLQPAPVAGRCLSLPPDCPPGAQDAGPPDCLLPCEYHPPAGKLDAEVKWSWGPVAKQFPNSTDIWSTPVVGRIYDTNCDGKVDELDPPNVVFVSGNTLGFNCGNANGDPDSCKTGVLRMLDGRTGQEIWSLRKASSTSMGFAGMSIAIGDLDPATPGLEIAASTGEGYIVIVSGEGKVLRTADKALSAAANGNFGWGGGLAVADMDGDGFPEISYGATVFTTANGKLTQKFSGAQGIGGGSPAWAMSAFADVDGNGSSELIAGRTVYKADGTTLWNRTDIPDGFPAVADLDGDNKPEVIMVSNAKMWILNGETGVTILGPVDVPGVKDAATGAHGGPPTVADFDGDGKREVGVAVQTFYSVMKPDFTAKAINVLWKMASHDLSSSQTGSTVFDFEGDGKAEVIYADECFLWVFDGANNGEVKFVASHSSFTADEASLVADVDGDGHAEVIMVSNSASPLSWGCIDAQNVPTKINGVDWVPGPTSNKGYRGMTVFSDKANSWVGTRTLWNEHTYHVSNICDNRDSACPAPNTYGSIPKNETENWTLPWLNNYRQNVQDKGLFNAPDATVVVQPRCLAPVVVDVFVRNLGSAILPADVKVGLFVRKGGTDTLLATLATTTGLFPGQAEKLTWTAKAGDTVSFHDTFVARIDPKANPKYHECRETNNDSPEVQASCGTPR